MLFFFLEFLLLDDEDDDEDEDEEEDDGALFLCDCVEEVVVIAVVVVVAMLFGSTVHRSMLCRWRMATNVYSLFGWTSPCAGTGKIQLLKTGKRKKMV